MNVNSITFTEEEKWFVKWLTYSFIAFVICAIGLKMFIVCGVVRC